MVQHTLHENKREAYIITCLTNIVFNGSFGVFDTLCLLSNENGSTNTLARSYYVKLKRKRNDSL